MVSTKTRLLRSKPSETKAVPSAQERASEPPAAEISAAMREVEVDVIEAEESGEVKAEAGKTAVV